MMELDMDYLWQLAKAHHELTLALDEPGAKVSSAHIKILQKWVGTFDSATVLELVERARANEDSHSDAG
jgi:hypothetical protein